MTAASLVTIVGRALAGEASLPRGSTLLLAVSGGPDSMALLDATARVARKLELSLVAHGVDHGLRAEAAGELDLAEAHARSLDVPFGRTLVEVEPGGNLQARAREARYRALAQAASEHEARAIATAHHRDDRAETLLLRLLRGAGAHGLAVLPPRAPLELDVERQHAAEPIELIRPLLRARRADVLAHLERHDVPASHDPSNENSRFLRVRVRRELLPLLEELDPGITSHLEALADELTALRSVSEGSSYALPRATQVALRELARTRSSSTRVWLPGGLVAAVDANPRGARGATRAEKPANQAVPRTSRRKD